MGSVGVYTGRLTTSQIGSLLTGDAERGRTGAISDRGGVPDRIFVDNENGRGGFTINFTGVPQGVRNQFLSILRGRTNTDNSQNAYTRAYNDAIARGLPEGVARRLAEDRRTEVTRRIVDRVN